MVGVELVGLEVEAAEGGRNSEGLPVGQVHNGGSHWAGVIEYLSAAAGVMVLYDV